MRNCGLPFAIIIGSNFCFVILFRPRGQSQIDKIPFVDVGRKWLGSGWLRLLGDQFFHDLLICRKCGPRENGLTKFDFLYYMGESG
jgi:hypothetical protein